MTSLHQQQQEADLAPQQGTARRELNRARRKAGVLKSFARWAGQEGLRPADIAALSEQLAERIDREHHSSDR